MRYLIADCLLVMGILVLANSTGPSAPWWAVTLGTILVIASRAVDRFR